MALSVFEDVGAPPNDAAVTAELGRSAAAWRRLIERANLLTGRVEPVWSFAGPKFGWSLRLVHRGRVLVYLTPQRGQFLAGFALGESAVAAAREAGLPAAIERALDAAPRYAEGRGVRLAVTRLSDLPAIETLVAAKAAAKSPARRRERARR